MLPRAGLSHVAMADAMAQFTVCRRPWNDYINTISKTDSEAYDAPLNPKPMYRGRKEGKTGWVARERVQLHYKRYPDERILLRLNQWRLGETLGDYELQRFKGAQPFILDKKDELGEGLPDSETYMKLNYKNPRTLGRFLTRTGHFYPRDILPMNLEAFAKLRAGVASARRVGLFPKYGNPFWFRSLSERPKPHKGSYDPLIGSVKDTMEHFSYNWLQTQRIRNHFQRQETILKKTSSGTGHAEERQQQGFEQDPLGMRELPGAFDEEAPFSEKITTVPGPISTKGLRKNKRLYQEADKMRYGNKDRKKASQKL